MLRSLHLIAAAIGLSAPTLPDAVVESYAEKVQSESREHGLDPLLVVSVVYNESRWLSSVTGGVGGRCIGLGGICLHSSKACQKGSTREECEDERTRLLNPLENLRTTAVLLESHREFCEQRVGHTSTADWLSSYQGFNNSKGRRGVWCNHTKVRGKWRHVGVPKTTKRVMRYRNTLARKLGVKSGA